MLWIASLLLSAVWASAEHDHDHGDGEMYYKVFDLHEEGPHILQISMNSSIMYDADEYVIIIARLNGSMTWEDPEPHIEEESGHVLNESALAGAANEVTGPGQVLVHGVITDSSDPAEEFEITAVQNHVTPGTGFWSQYIINIDEHGDWVFYISPEPPNADANTLLMDPDGHFLTPEEEGHGTTPTPAPAADSNELSTGGVWGHALAGTFVSAIASVLGALVIIMMGGFKWLEGMLTWFASGIIIGVSCLHLIGEAGELNNNGWPHNKKLAAALIGGLFIGMMVDSIADYMGGGHGHGHAGMASGGDMQDTWDKDKPTTQMAKIGSSTSMEDGGDEVTVIKSAKTGSIGWAALVADAFHNFFDGFIIAEAFDDCGTTKGWTLAAAILCHELPQEMSDYYVMIESGWSIGWAMFANVMVSMTAFIGVFVYMGLREELSKHDISYFLAVSAGCFLYIGVAIVNHVSREAGKYPNFNHPLLLFVCFWVGFMVIYGLMEWHPVCSVVVTNADGTTTVVDGHEGHGH